MKAIRSRWTSTTDEDNHLGLPLQTHVHVEVIGNDVHVMLLGDRVISGVPTYREYRGTMHVEREPWGIRIARVTVSSLLGDIVGEDRTMIGAAQDYASKVLREERDQDRREFNRRAHEFDLLVGNGTV